MTRFIVTIAVLAMGAFGAAAQLEQKLDALDAVLGEIYDGNPVSLQQCIDVALVGNVQIGSFEEEVMNANTAKLSAKAQFLPSLSADASWSKSRRTDFDSPVTEYSSNPLPVYFQDVNGNPLGPLQIGGETAYLDAGMASIIGTEDATNRFESRSGGASANLTLFRGFSRFAGLRRASADHEASVARLDYQRDLIVQNVANRYMDLVKAIRKVEVAEQSEELAGEELERSETYFELGISTRSDVLQQKVNHQNTKLVTVTERNNMRNAFVLLAHSMGVPSSAQFEIEVLVPGANEMLVPELAPLLSQAATERLDLHASALNVEGRDAGVTEAKAGLYPEVSLFARYSRSTTESPQSLRLGAQSNDALSWGISGSWNLFDRFATKESKRRAIAQKRIAEYNRRIDALNVEAEVVSIHNNLSEAVERFELATQTVEQAEEDLRLAQERFRVGAGTSLDVINAQVGLAQARRDVVDAQADYIKFRHQLRRASGESMH
jgi:outer membrane protein TolC